ncbi:RNA polymerase sigma factor [Marinoscillum sp. MHG1-6]|uniref:RNA polymerase sigma factor n=1 Tax=Marinoscillum sp. MHG1-6 TaxID=2959627 RepID=UPI0021586C15|nr:RNA polymerase sigma-70 factor [Marinoscillum sp. MHG1-6]
MKIKELSGLVEKLKAGDEKAFGRLYDHFSAKLYNTCRKMWLDHQDAEGVVQEVFIKLWRRREYLDPELSINSYLLSITRSLVIKHFRDRAYKTAYEQYAISNMDSRSNITEDYIIFANMEDLSAKALDELPDKQKQIFMMKNVDFHSVEEISDKLGISVRTVENQIYRATKSLKEKLINMRVISVLIWFLFV